MSEQQQNKNLLGSVVWTITQSFGTQIVTILISMFLSRLITPADNGFITMVTTITTLAPVIIDSGMKSSIMRKYDARDIDYNTVFLYNLCSAVIVYLILFFCAPLISLFFEEPRLTPIFRVSALTVIIGAVYSLQEARLEKNFNFRPLTFVNILANLFSGLMGLTMAYNGFGVWSLVAIQLSTPLIVTTYIWKKSNWRPDLSFDKKIFKEHFKFGYKVALSTVLHNLFGGIYNLIIGKKYTASLLGQYSRAYQLSMMMAFSIGGAINRIVLPLFASKAADIDQLKSTYLRVLRMLMFVMVPIATYATIAAPAIINSLYGRQWGTAVDYFTILASMSVIYSVNMISLYVISITGRSDLSLKADFVKKTISILFIFLAAMRGGIYDLIWVSILILIVELLINFKYCTLIISGSVLEQVKMLLPSLIIAVVSGIPFYFYYHFLEGIIENSFLMVALTLPVFFMLFMSLAWLVPSAGLSDLLKFTKLDQKIPERFRARLG